MSGIKEDSASNTLDSSGVSLSSASTTYIQTVDGDIDWGWSINAGPNEGLPSLNDRLTAIEDRLTILNPDTALMEKYPALQEAYDHYKLIEKLVKDGKK